ncbi:ATP-grasp domain-containing protein [Actinoplanes sp. NEAU-A12]|uniref:ATP-grasp domain-containing protein n=1 Tax=Actinoplanes sandaracinus TaxID=3045177 RepID=A0ABT6WBN5_9ACTN|nr:ATP-grasp domain-containing protein [Actinoplanes sandaracinus]MDI6097136.1 ATP-grasp domain-containing protein [Actinoplanes sandaracinus]
MLLVPSDVLRPRRPDEHFAEEARAARDAGIEVALIDHDALSSGEPAGAAGTGASGVGDSAAAAVSRVPAGADAVYRGWMLSSERYAALAGALAARGVTLRTSPEQYRRAHELPGWYAAVGSATPETVWTDGDGREGFVRACAALGAGPAVLRDYTKSMKHYWHEAAYLPDVTDGVAAWAVASRFRELRGDGFTGGFVLRRFESFTGAEVRTWWVGGSCRLATAHPDTPDDLPSDGVDLPGVGDAIGALGLPFVTADLTRHADGRWRVVEIGDGQVSDRPRTTGADELIAALSSR